MTKRILVTGSSGFIGSSLCYQLNDIGYKVFGIDNNKYRPLDAMHGDGGEGMNQGLHDKLLLRRLSRIDFKHATPCNLDITDQDAVDAYFDDHDKFDAVVHCAAIPSAIKTERYAQDATKIALSGLTNILKHAKSFDKFIYLSSSMVYGNFDTPAIGECHQLRPVNLYGELKKGAEDLVRNMINEHVILRLISVYGPYDDNERVVGKLISRITQEHIVTLKKGAILDLTYIDDVVHGIMATIENDNGNGDTFNFSYGYGYELTALVNEIRKNIIFVPQERIEQHRGSAGDPDRGVLNSEKFTETYGQQAEIGLEEGIKRTMAWRFAGG